MLPVWPMIDEMLMMRPVPRSTMCSSAAFDRKNAPDRFTSRTLCQSSSLILKTVLSTVMPALLTRMSSRPWRSSTSLIVRRQSSGMPMFPWCVEVSMLASDRSAVRRSAASESRL